METLSKYTKTAINEFDTKMKSNTFDYLCGDVMSNVFGIWEEIDDKILNNIVSPIIASLNPKVNE